MTRLLRIIVAASVLLVAGCDAQNSPEAPEISPSERREAPKADPPKIPSETKEKFHNGGGDM